MRIDLLQGINQKVANERRLNGFSRFSPQNSESINGFSRVNHLNGYQLNRTKSRKRNFKFANTNSEPIVSSRISGKRMQMLRSGMNGYQLNACGLQGDYFLDFDIDPNSLQGKKERKARREARRRKRQGKQSTRKQRKAKKSAKREARKQERQLHKSRRKEARTVKKEKRSTRREDRQEARRQRILARQDARTERRRLREERKEQRGPLFGEGFGENITDIVSQFTGGEGSPLEMAQEFASQYIPDEYQDIVSRVGGRFDLLPDDIQEDIASQRGQIVDDATAGSGQGGWWSQQDNMTKGLIIGGGALAGYFVAKQMGLFDKKKKRR